MQCKNIVNNRVSQKHKIFNEWIKRETELLLMLFGSWMAAIIEGLTLRIRLDTHKIKWRPILSILAYSLHNHAGNCIYLPWVSGSPPFQWFTFSQGIAHPGCSVDVKTEDQKGLLWPDCTLSHHASDRRFRWPVLDAVCRDHTLSISRQGNLRSDPCQSK